MRQPPKAAAPARSRPRPAKKAPARQDLPAAQAPEPRIVENVSGRNQESVPVETIEEAAEDEQEQDEIRGRGQVRRGLDN